MRTSIRATAVLLLAAAGPLNAQQPTGLVGDLLKDISEVEGKMVSLAKAMPESSWNWRPGTGVRSVGEVYQHVATDNYLIPSFLGAAPPASTGINPKDYKTAQAYETRKATRDAAIADLQASFANLKKVLTATPSGKLGDEVNFFGQKSTLQQVWIGTTTHLHEHLGQAIAYARTNNVVPPWSKGGN